MRYIIDTDQGEEVSVFGSEHDKIIYLNSKMFTIRDAKEVIAALELAVIDAGGTLDE